MLGESGRWGCNSGGRREKRKEHPRAVSAVFGILELTLVGRCGPSDLSVTVNIRGKTRGPRAPSVLTLLLLLPLHDPGPPALWEIVGAPGDGGLEPPIPKPDASSSDLKHPGVTCADPWDLWGHRSQHGAPREPAGWPVSWQLAAKVSRETAGILFWRWNFPRKWQNTISWCLISHPR